MLGAAAQPLDELENSEDLGAVSGHLPVAGLPPSQTAVPVHDQRGAVGDVPILIEDSVVADDRPVHVAQEGERVVPRPGKLGLARLAVAADGEELRPAFPDPFGDLTQAGKLRRSDAAPRIAEEGQHDVGLALELLERDRPPKRRGEREIRSRVAETWCHAPSPFARHRAT
jgi:hypothetical protein